MDTNILKADGVDHTAHGFHNSRRWIPSHGLEGNSLGDEGPQTIEIHHGGKLLAVAKGPRCYHNGVFQCNPRYIN